MWILMRGHVEIHESVINKDEKSEGDTKGVITHETKTLEAVSTIGEQALLDNKNRTFSVVCKDDCEFALLEKADYAEIKRKV